MTETQQPLMTTLTEAFEEAGRMLDRVIYLTLSQLTEKWYMNNGADGFAEFHVTHPAGSHFDRETLEETVSMKINGLPNYEEADWIDIVAMVQDDNFLDMKPKRLYQYARKNRDAIIACASDTWIQQQYARWFEGTDRFWAVCRYHLRDDDKLFFNWLIRK
jgi:hypothetical protein